MFDTRLNSFLTVAKFKSFSKAGEILNLTQPAISQHMKFLEEYYGAKLTKKMGKEIILTEEGLILFKYASQIEALYTSLQSELRNKSMIIKTYNVGATLTIGGYVLPHILGEHKKLNSNINILLHVGNTEEITKKLLYRKLDMAVVEGPFDRSRFLYKKFKDDELVLAVSPSHPFAQKEEADLNEVLDGNLIIREKGSGTRKIMENRLSVLGYDMSSFKAYMEIGSIDAIKSMVESNLGYTIISREAIKKEIELGIIKVVPVKGVRFIREFNFLYLPGLSDDFVTDFIKYCISCM